MHSTLSKGKAAAAERGGLILFALNLVGAVTYVIAASRGGWITAQDRELHAVTGEPFVWAFSVFPIWAVFLLLNLVWGTVLHARHKRRSGLWWLMTIPVWLIAIAIDITVLGRRRLSFSEPQREHQS